MRKYKVKRGEINLEIKTLEVAGIIPALQSMRNPMNSWSKNDSFITKYLESGMKESYAVKEKAVIGKNDLDLAQRLISAGSEHMKFMRAIQVWADLDMPRYFWSEFDTYKFNTKNSCSTMHRLLHKTTKITKDLFVYNEKDDDIINIIIERLNEIRLEYLDTKDISLIRRAKQLLPEGMLQLRTVNTNYAELRNIYLQRKSHKLKEEWQETFCEWVKTLPYAEELILYGVDK